MDASSSAGRAFFLLSSFCPLVPTGLTLKMVLVGLFCHLDQLPPARIPSEYTPRILPFRVDPRVNHFALHQLPSPSLTTLGTFRRLLAQPHQPEIGKPNSYQENDAQKSTYH